jgi:hypothetical protein
MDDFCEICGVPAPGSRHYHCPHCNFTCGVQGHFACRDAARASETYFASLQVLPRREALASLTQLLLDLADVYEQSPEGDRVYAAYVALHAKEP